MKYTLRKVGIDGEKKGYYYAGAFHNRTVDTREVLDTIQKNCTVKPSDASAVFHEFIDVISAILREGNSVKIDGLGTFSLSIIGTSVKDPNTVGDLTIKGAKVNFQPERREATSYIETRADGSVVKHKFFASELTKNITFEPLMTQVKPILDAYNKANGNTGA